jgi:hypothetical protein
MRTFLTSRAVWVDRSLSLEAKVIWHILAAAADETDKAVPPPLALQQLSGIGRERVRRAIAELIKAGAITRSIRQIRTGSKAAGALITYTVRSPAGWEARHE